MKINTFNSSRDYKRFKLKMNWSIWPSLVFQEYEDGKRFLLLYCFQRGIHMQLPDKKHEYNIKVKTKFVYDKEALKCLQR